MRIHRLLLGACCVAALAACSDSGPTSNGTGAEVTLRALNGAPVGSAAAAVDSVYVTAEIRLQAGAPAVTSAALVLDGGPVLATTDVSVAPGARATVTVGSHLVPSGARTVRVLARSDEGGTVASSAPVQVTLTRPRTYLRVLGVNGAPLPAGGAPAAVADSFLVDVRLVLADTGSVIDRITLRRDTVVDSVVDFVGISLNLSQVQLQPGQTHRIPYVAWLVLPGRYSVILNAEHSGSSTFETAATTGPIPVSVTSTDVTAPVIRAPTNELVLSDPGQIPIEAFDERGIWQFSLEQPGRCRMLTWSLVPGPATTRTFRGTRGLCLNPGRNQVIRRTVDTSGNVTTDEVTLIVPATAAAASRSAMPRRTVVRQLPGGIVERVTGPGSGG